MKGHEEVLTLLNNLLTNELTAINQYFIHAKMCENWGFERLAHKIREESIDEMKHADQVISRILFLEGVPNLQRYHKLHVGETVKEGAVVTQGVWWNKYTPDGVNCNATTSSRLTDFGAGATFFDNLVEVAAENGWRGQMP